MSWRADILHRFAEVGSKGDEHALFDEIASAARMLGFQDVAYGFKAAVPVNGAEVVMLNTYSDSWRTRYAENGYLAIDPTVAHALRETRPLLWDSAIRESAPEFWEEASAAGLVHGIGIAQRDTHGSVGLLSVARSAEALTDAELDVVEARLLWLTNLAHSAMSQILTSKLIPEVNEQFIPRELEILKWTALGKSRDAVAEIVGITGRTVDYHIAKILIKLRSANKAEAALKAVLLGII